MADVAAEIEADSGSGGPSNIADGSATPEPELERSDSERVTGKLFLFTYLFCLHLKFI